MDKFTQGCYNDAIDYWEGMLSKDGMSSYDEVVILHNIATAQYKLELYRKCLKTTQVVIEKEVTYLASYLLQGKAYVAIGKDDKAIEVWDKGLSQLRNPSIICDASMFTELQCLISSHSSGSSAKSINDMNNMSIKTDDTIVHHSKVGIKNEDSNKSKEIDHKMSGSRSDVVKLFDAYIGSEVNPSFLRKVRSNLLFASGDAMIDDLIAFGYLQVNTGKLDVACHIFSTLLKCHDNLPAAYLGLGSSYAMLGQYDEAILVFTEVIIKDASIADAWKRRGQTKAAKGLIQDAISDLEKAVQLGTDADVYNQLGLVYHQCRNFRKALGYFRKANERGVNTASLFNFIGICEGQVGNIDESVKAHAVAMELDPTFKETALNHALMLKEVGRWKEAEEGFEKAMRLDTNGAIHQAYTYKATFLYQMGRALESFDCSVQAIEAMRISGSTDINSVILAACALHSLGRYKSAVSYYDRALIIDSSNACWFQREIALHAWGLLDTPIEQLSDDLDPRIKDGVCKKCKWQKVINSKTDVKKYVPLPVPKAVLSFEETTHRDIEQQVDIINLITPLMPLVQLNARGFLPNKRQHVSFGLAVLEMAQTLHYLASCGNDTKVGWRELLNIVVRWRHISEPGDAVFWIDSLPPKEFEEGFGLQTPLVNGQLKTIRYYSYYPLAFQRMLSLLDSGYYSIGGTYEKLSPLNRNLLISATSLEEVRRIVGQDFYVIVPCHSDCERGLVMEGTRLTLLTHDPEGFEFSIRTPGLPHRWALFDRELQVIVDKLVHLIVAKDSVFAPLSRGTAFCGYAALSATLQAAGYEVKGPLPKNKQLDWEAIFANNFEEFVPVALSLLQLGDSSIALNSLTLRDKVRTLRDMVKMVNVIL